MPRRAAAVLLACALVALAVAGPGTAQAGGAGAPRQPTFVRVESADGTPLAGAVVTFCGFVPHVGELGPREEHHVQTDARGRARAHLLPGLCYVAWAVGPVDAQGHAAATPAHGLLAAGSVLALRCAPPAPPRTVRIDGGAAWAHRGPLRYVVCTASPSIELEVAPADGALVLPHGPFAAIEVRTADGEPLWQMSAGTAAGTLPPPQRLRVRAVDERGGPLADVPISLRTARLVPWRLDAATAATGDRRRQLGRTDADGRCEVEVPYPSPPLQQQSRTELLLFAEPEGREAGVGGVVNNTLLSDGGPQAPPLDELLLRCPRVAPLRGALGRAPAGTVVHVVAVCQLPLGRGGFLHDPRSFTAPVDADGSFVFDTLPARVVALRWTLLPPGPQAEPWPMLPATAARELPRELDPAIANALAAPDHGDLELGVLEPGGGPARGAVAMLAPIAANRVMARDATVRVPLDARGGAALRLPPGRWVLGVCTDAGWAATVVDVAGGPQRIALPMSPHALARLELRGPDGAPIAGARVVQRGSTMRGTTDPVQAMLQGMRTWSNQRWPALATGADGRVAVPFVPVESIAMRIGLTWDGGSTGDVTLEPTAEWLVVQPR